MKTFFLIAAALVFPLVWGYLAEQLLRRIWPQKQENSAGAAGGQHKDDQQPFTLDYQI